jgi:hypothetical protein
MKKSVVLSLLMAVASLLNAQNASNSSGITTEQDHQNMMQQLGIKSLRPGPSGNATAPNHANYDESLANPCPQLPDVLTMKNGKKVTTAKQWWSKRRPEIIDDFEREVYGKIPAKVPSVLWSCLASDTTTLGGTPVLTKKLQGHVDNSSFPQIKVDINMVLVLPTNVKGPIPVLIMFGWPRYPITSDNAMSTDLLLAAGWGYVTIDPNSIQADNGAGLTKGIVGLVNGGQPRKPDDWGSLRAWSWGAARALDYLETEPLVDARKVGIEGVSRYGKAALVTLAFETRFAIGLIGSSGKGGATLLRRVFGEAVESLAGSGEYHWMCGNYLKYAETDGKTACDLPVDSHELIALCAPKPTFISYGIPEKGDANWLDQQGSFMATIAAGSVFKLVGAKDLGVSNDYLTEKMPPVLSGLLDGQLAWRQHDGGHTDVPNFQSFISWANAQLNYQKNHDCKNSINH